MYDLIPGETYKLPPEAEGLEPEVAPAAPEPAAEKKATDVGPPPFPAITRTQPSELVPEPIAAEEDQGVGRTNTRRHIRSSPSTGSAVTTVVEADEDEAADLTKKTKNLSISAPPVPLEEEPEAEEVPVIVEDSVMHHQSPTEDVETPVQPTAGKGEASSGGNQEVAETPSGEEAEPASLGETHADTKPPAPEVESANAEEVKPEVEKAAEEEDPANEKGDAAAEVDSAPQTESKDSEPAGDSDAPKPEESSDAGKPNAPEATESAEASSGAADTTSDVKTEEEPKKE